MWEYVLGGATIFGLIVGLFSVYNGRATRKLLIEEERMTRELIARMDERLAKMDERFAKMDERFAKMDERFEMILKQSSEEHKKILEAMKELRSHPERGM
ncbi:MAG: hypothetical protein RMJ00_04970 [Nitrososphaerota archaeon]|nr:hypothetical protein [Candidatus Bathyarchaeota archaeon]MCX8162132.1 hypothetical protein [Candidatus Bathyarchaeota archaeon]MDW8062033.1 hypothetical protein [Nitrososphaerota archaeon]